MRRTEGHPILPATVYSDVYDILGVDGADEILDQVQEGRITVEDVERMLERDDIDPEDWEAFEDGWRPENW